jgi:hypothetical protein
VDVAYRVRCCVPIFICYPVENPARTLQPPIDARSADAEPRVEKAVNEVLRKVAEADLRPMRYLAQLLSADGETALRWFVLIVACLLDPAAVLLLLAATARRQLP